MFRVRSNKWKDPSGLYEIKFHFLKLGSLCIKIKDNRELNCSDEFVGLHEYRGITQQYLKPPHVQRVAHNKANLRAFARQQRRAKQKFVLSLVAAS